MRNLLEYPVTKQELLLHLGAERSAYDPEITGLCGDMTPLYLDAIIKIVTAAFEMCDGFERRMSEKGMGFVTPFPEATKLMQACQMKLGSSEPLGPHYDGTTMDNQQLQAGPGGGMTTAHKDS